MHALKRTMVVGIITMCLLMTAVWGYADAFEKNMVSLRTKTVGEDQIPYTVLKIRGYTGTVAWLQNNFSDDPSAPIHYLPKTLQDIKVKRHHGIAFKTWEHQNYVQNILIEKGNHLVLYSTPHGKFNPDGSRVFREILGFALTQKESMRLNEEDRLASEGTILEAPEHPFRETPLSSYGSSVGSYRAVNAYSNGSNGYYSGKSNYYNGYRTGIKWQCVEYADRFFKAIFNRQVTGGNANTYYSNASAKGLNRAPNGGTNGPRPGNILCSAGGSYGHVAIIREVGPNYVKVIHQNWSNSSSDNSKTLSMTVQNGKYKISGFSSSYPVQGWLWPR